MQKRILGGTNYEVSVVGLGGIPIQRVDKSTAVDIIREALNQGMNFIDTARGYTISEELIGQGLQIVGREKFILATKSMVRTYEGMLEEVKTSLQNLKTEYIDLYQLHNVRTMEDFKFVMSEEGALRALKELKEQGIIGEIGISSHGVEVLEAAIDSGEFATIQFPYNAVERQGEPLFEKAKKKNIGVIIMKPLAGGAIRNGEQAIRFILENSNVSVVIPGIDSVEQVVENAKPGIDELPLTSEDREKLEAEATSLGTQFCRRCGYCAPCTIGIDIPNNFIFDSYYTRYNLQEWATNRFKSLSPWAKDCTECGECEKRCPYDLPIINMLKEVASHYDF
ncbi:aldo/keto reductase [Tissierella sp. Yu-01]|uniref:aldo/keto reductase n=1 Tax=Tissierella sp. Yu-01 TaxID=3035694 RepID=UPI00240D34AD|nr:aldo/keto reductase [Tissierella sp. Yu-01]WFA08631.1 aldo/keto reductase [Tissierella sp. Yu-01]